MDFDHDKKIVAVDFDGVLNSYASGWNGADVIADPPTLTEDFDAIQWLRDLIDHPELRVAIFSSRNHQPGGQVAMMEWLEENGLEAEYMQKIELPLNKPPAWVTVDDRVITFDPKNFAAITPEAIAAFTPWHGQGV
jgi:hypothetical protein